MAKAIMVQGTASSAGKSVLATALCRIFRQDGFSVAPFKSQNMALNSFVTDEGLEMGRAQVMQAEAAGVEPIVAMNPILLKPIGDATSQVIVNGEVAGKLSAVDYYRRKRDFTPHVRAAYQSLADVYDIVVIEGAGSPAEINLAEDDIVNMGMAAMADAPVLLVGDIDRGGVFASLYGTAALLRPEERERIKGVVINKFRGDVEILEPGLAQLEDLLHVPVLGVIPWLDIDLDDEDSVSRRLEGRSHGKPVDVAVIRLPRISNFTDFNALERQPALGVRYVAKPGDLGAPDLIVIPGSKSTMEDLLWLRHNGLEAQIKRLAASGVPIIGICGGFQMLGLEIYDPEEVESGGSLRGMELIQVKTKFGGNKVRTRVAGTVADHDGFFAPLSGATFSGYEIHMGRSVLEEDAVVFAHLSGADKTVSDGAVAGRILGTYVHGLFDSGDLAGKLAETLLAEKGAPAIQAETVDARVYKDRQYDLLASAVRAALDMPAVYRIMGMPEKSGKTRQSSFT